MGYWDATDDYLSGHGGHGPTCPHCGKEMFPQDDHGRFMCFCGGGETLDAVTDTIIPAPPPIPQVDTSDMSNTEKAKIPPINRLDSTPTAAEAKVLSILLRGPEAMNDPEYLEAMAAIDEERGKGRRKKK